ncbi:unnamed protein product [Gongylonema pulchrum]|uniref:Uncharacterized protein n=1 Tax=Gongylonema pulchrum TaxID=637853 RepID=A0A183DGS1_9BILA|nr:unnamed protein product [Gongylonema pulchrum]
MSSLKQNLPFMDRNKGIMDTDRGFPAGLARSKAPGFGFSEKSFELNGPQVACVIGQPQQHHPKAEESCHFFTNGSEFLKNTIGCNGGFVCLAETVPQATSVMPVNEASWKEKQEKLFWARAPNASQPSLLAPSQSQKPGIFTHSVDIFFRRRFSCLSRFCAARVIM